MKGERKPNIVFLSMDALRTKNLGCYGYHRNTSPNIDSYAKQGTLFKNHFTSQFTSDKSISAILTGRHISTKEPRHYPNKEEMQDFFNAGGILLQEVLQKNGYKTFFLRKLFGWQKRGFDFSFKQDIEESAPKWNMIKTVKKMPFIYSTMQYLLHHTHLIPKKLENKIRRINSSERALDTTLRLIKENRNNSFFLWIHFLDTHLPHSFSYHLINKFLPNKEGKKVFELLNPKDYPKEHMDQFKRFWKFDETVGGVTARYDTAIFYDDSLIKKIIDSLEEEGLMENTIVFIFADHGTSIDDHGIYFTSLGLYDVTAHIPLIIFGKEISKAKKINALTQLEDLAPTVLDLIGINYDSEIFDGKSLLPLVQGKKKELRKSIFMEENNLGLKKKAIRTKKYKYMQSPEKEYSVCEVCNTSHGPLVGLFDLEKDPDENINLAEKNKKLAKTMKSKLDKSFGELKKINEKRRIQNLIRTKKLLWK